MPRGSRLRAREAPAWVAGARRQVCTEATAPGNNQDTRPHTELRGSRRWGRLNGPVSLQGRAGLISAPRALAPQGPGALGTGGRVRGSIRPEVLTLEPASEFLQDLLKPAAGPAPDCPIQSLWGLRLCSADHFLAIHSSRAPSLPGSSPSSTCRVLRPGMGQTCCPRHGALVTLVGLSVRASVPAAPSWSVPWAPPRLFLLKPPPLP